MRRALSGVLWSEGPSISGVLWNSARSTVITIGRSVELRFRTLGRSVERRAEILGRSVERPLTVRALCGTLSRIPRAFCGMDGSTRVSRKDSSGKFVGHTHTTVLLDELLISDRSLTPSGDEGELRSSEPIFIRFGHRYAESIREGLHQMLAVEMLASLKQPTARSLYRVLQAHRVQPDGSLSQQLNVLLSD